MTWFQNFKIFMVCKFGSYWPKNWWKKEVMLSYMIQESRNRLETNMDILRILRDIEFFNFYLQFQNQNKEQMNVMKQIKKMSKYVIYIDEDERHKNFTTSLLETVEQGQNDAPEISPVSGRRKRDRRGGQIVRTSTRNSHIRRINKIIQSQSKKGLGDSKNNDEENPSGSSSSDDSIVSEFDPNKPLSEVKESSGSNVSFEMLSRRDQTEKESKHEVSKINQ